MKMKKYIVKSLSEVDALIRRDLGPNAVILTVRKIKPKGISSVFFSDQLEVVAAVEEQTKDIGNTREWESSKQALAEIHDGPEEKSLTGLKEPAQYETSTVPGTYLDPRFNRKQVVETANETIVPGVKEASETIKDSFIPPSQTEDEMLLNKQFFSELDDIKRVSKSLVSQFAFTTETSNAAPADANWETVLNLENESRAYQYLMPCLLSKGLEPSFAETVAKSCQARYGVGLWSKGTEDEAFLECLAKEIAERIPVAGPLLIAKGVPTCMGIVGPSGIGKTTALLKIAYQYTTEAHKNAAIIAIDLEDLGNNLKHTGLPVAYVHNKQEWEEALANFQDQDLILVDLPPQLMEEWAESLQGELQVQLALPAGIKTADAQRWVSYYSPLSPKALLITKTDETTSLGPIPTLCEISGLPLSYLTSGPKVASDLQIADPKALAKAIVQGNTIL